MTASANVSTMIANAAYRKAYLLFTQEMVESAAVSQTLISEVIKVFGQTHPENQRIRFRSSTNAEDLPGLSGAGLYSSKGGCAADTNNPDAAGPSACQTPLERKRTIALISELKKKDPKKYADVIADLEDDLDKKRPIHKAIGKVYASLWNERAFLSRDYYRLDHNKIFMGILVHPSYVDELANGVLISAEQTDGSLLVDVVSQKDDISITNPMVEDAIPEQAFVIVSASGQLGTPQYRTLSNQVPVGTKVLSPAELQNLAKQVFIVRNALKAEYGAEYAKTLDMEFKVGPGRSVEIKQARPL
jgi:phosphoenolpyruvate synthase/pyruvate phosphate dikinase